MNKLLETIKPEKITFRWRENAAFRGVLNRATRRKLMHKSRRGTLMNTDLPIWMLLAQ